MRITLTPETEAKLRRKAEAEGQDLNQMANALLGTLLDDQAEAPAPATSPLNGVDEQERPFRRDPRLMGIRFNEEPTAPISAEDWPEALNLDKALQIAAMLEDEETIRRMGRQK